MQAGLLQFPSQSVRIGPLLQCVPRLQRRANETRSTFERLSANQRRGTDSTSPIPQSCRSTSQRSRRPRLQNASQFPLRSKRRSATAGSQRSATSARERLTNSQRAARHVLSNLQSEAISTPANPPSTPLGVSSACVREPSSVPKDVYEEERRPVLTPPWVPSHLARTEAMGGNKP